MSTTLLTRATWRANIASGGNRTPFRDVAEAAAKRYPAGRAVIVYYNPADPSQGRSGAGRVVRQFRPARDRRHDSGSGAAGEEIRGSDRPHASEVTPMLGILVKGDNHFIVRGPRPDRGEALALARYWSIIRIGEPMPAALEQWRISTREFRENLEWAIVTPGDGGMSPAVDRLLGELRARGIRILDTEAGEW